MSSFDDLSPEAIRKDRERRKEEAREAEVKEQERLGQEHENFERRIADYRYVAEATLNDLGRTVFPSNVRWKVHKQRNPFYISYSYSKKTGWLSRSQYGANSVGVSFESYGARVGTVKTHYRSWSGDGETSSYGTNYQEDGVEMGDYSQVVPYNEDFESNLVSALRSAFKGSSRHWEED